MAELVTFKIQFVNVASRDLSIAIRTSWLRVRTPVLSNSCCRLPLTELRDTPIWRAISLFVSPSRIPRSTCRSLGVSPGARFRLEVDDASPFW